MVFEILFRGGASTEIFDVLKSKEPFKEARYVAGLRGLPKMPWEGKE